MRSAIGLLFGSSLLIACSSGSSSPSPSGDDCTIKVTGVCVGAPAKAICDGASCTDGVSCSAVVNVSSSAQLASAVSSVSAGGCIALAAGTYDAVTLPDGVSLLGTGASVVAVQGITINGGTGATIRGLTVRGGGLSATNAHTLTLDRIVVADGTAFGLWLTDTDATIHASTFQNDAVAGIYAQCKTACDPKPKLSIDATLVTNNTQAGMLLDGVDVTVRTTQVESTRALSFLFGRGIEASNSTVNASALVVQNNADIGIVAIGGDLTLGPDLVVSKNVRGVQLQGVASAKMAGFQLRDNGGVAIGCDDAHAVVLQGGLVASTPLASMPVDLGGSQEVGDGLNWLHGSDVNVDATVTFQGSGRRAVIADVTSTGSFAGTLGGGDETHGVVLQGGDVASSPSGLSIAGGAKVERLGASDALPVAVAAAPVKAPGG